MLVLTKITHCNIHTTGDSEKVCGPFRARRPVVGPHWYRQLVEKNT